MQSKHMFLVRGSGTGERQLRKKEFYNRVKVKMIYKVT